MSTLTKTIQGGEFLVRETSAQDIFIPEEFSEEQKMMAQACQDFIDTEIPPHRHALQSMTTPDLGAAIFERPGAVGLPGVAVPEEYGGLGRSLSTSVLIGDIIWAAGSFSTSCGAHTRIGALPILYCGSEEQ